jgi:hypothetical protein
LRPPKRWFSVFSCKPENTKIPTVLGNLGHLTLFWATSRPGLELLSTSWLLRAIRCAPATRRFENEGTAFPAVAVLLWQLHVRWRSTESERVFAPSMLAESGAPGLHHPQRILIIVALSPPLNNPLFAPLLRKLRAHEPPRRGDCAVGVGRTRSNPWWCQRLGV